MTRLKGWFENLIQGELELFDFEGAPVAVEGLQWRLNTISEGTATINWTNCKSFPRPISEGMVAYMRFIVSTKSSSHCINTFTALKDFGSSCQLNDGLRAALLQHLTTLRSRGSEYRFHYLRDWYRWSHDQQLRGFSEDDFLYELQSLRIPGNLKGDAVRSEDPTEGPLDEIEEAALRAALIRDDGPLLDRVLIWSFLALGCNPKNLVHLCESDMSVLRNGHDVFYSLRVPRIKKRQNPRAEFKVRKLDPFLAHLIERLIEQNAELPIGDGFSRPLFARSSPRPNLAGTPTERYAFHFTSLGLKQIVEKTCWRLSVVSHRTGKALQLSPRRLRYTFATRKVQEGCSMEALADLLDHTDLQQVAVYYSGQGLSRRLDEALAVSVGPLVNRFMGRVVADESEAIDGGGRIKAQPMGRIANIGTCGSTTLCTLYPPASCYVCPKFQPWRDAPHREVLKDLIKQRDSRVEETGRADDRIAKQFDEMILAVGQVVALCESGK